MCFSVLTALGVLLIFLMHVYCGFLWFSLCIPVYILGKSWAISLKGLRFIEMHQYMRIEHKSNISQWIRGISGDVLIKSSAYQSFKTKITVFKTTMTWDWLLARRRLYLNSSEYFCTKINAFSWMKIHFNNHVYNCYRITIVFRGILPAIVFDFTRKIHILHSLLF